MGLLDKVFSDKAGKETKESKEASELNRLTIARLKREEADIAEAEAERRRLLESGRLGRKSLLTAGFLGPGLVGGKQRQPGGPVDESTLPAPAEPSAKDRIAQRIARRQK